MAKKQWIDPKGNEIPAQYVPKLDKKKDKFALAMLKKAQDLNRRLSEFKQLLVEGGDEIWADMQEAENVRTGKKGYSIMSFDKKIKIEMNQSERIEFDDNIEIAKALIDEYLTDKLASSDVDLKQIVHMAFETRSGQLDTKKVVSLFRLNINNEKWKRAIEIIRKSMSSNISKRYVSIYLKNNQDMYKDVKLNFSSID